MNSELTSVQSFGFATPPRVDITLAAGMTRDKTPQGRRAYGSQPRQGIEGRQKK